MNTFTYCRCNSFQLIVLITFSDIHLCDNIILVYPAWTYRFFSQFKTIFFAPDINVHFINSIQLLVFRLDSLPHPCTESIHFGYLFQDTPDLPEKSLVITDIHHFLRMRRRSHYINFGCYKIQILQFLLMTYDCLLGYISQMCGRSRCQSMFSKENFIYRFHTIILSLFIFIKNLLYTIRKSTLQYKFFLYKIVKYILMDYSQSIYRK